MAAEVQASSSSAESPQFWVETVDDDGHPFWYHTQTHRATRSDPRAPAAIDGWTPAVDPATGRTYYCHASTGTTSWTAPDTIAPVASNGSSVGATSGARARGVGAEIGAAQYTQQATFNRGSGRFGGTGAAGDHWSRKGIADDKSGRQMGAYFDVSQLEANRAAAACQKQQRLAASATATDWKALKRDRKEKRRQDQKRALAQE